jgi:spermidine/putrescine transport system ATP-binding protein
VNADEGPAGGHVQLVDLAKRFGDFEAVCGIDLDIPPGEFFSLLGPSGCGKTTTLRMIAGFERPSGGRVFLDGQDVSDTPPNRRNVNTVFQSYALFSHLTVAENVAFGLRFAKASREEVRSRVGDALSLVRMREFRDRRPHQLSGGQQQRVALARALILNPSVLLLDEPLGALDAKLRKALQIELKALQEQVGITFVYVTHDQEEALTMADRLAVMNEGRIEQVGSPREVYEEPASAYVADFLGVSNMLDVQAMGTDSDGRCRVRVGDFELLASQGHTSRPEVPSQSWCVPSACGWRPPARPARTDYRGRSNASSTPAPSPNSWSPSTAEPRSDACWPTTGWGLSSTAERRCRCICRAKPCAC